MRDPDCEERQQGHVMFSEEFQEQLRLGKYTGWVNRHSEDSLGDHISIEEAKRRIREAVPEDENLAKT